MTACYYLSFFWTIGTSRTQIFILNTMLKQIEIFSNLESNWRFNRWNLDKLEKICLKIDDGLQELNPNLFFGKEIGYIDHVKSRYLLEYCF